jgi:hypothetical protein
VGTIRGWFWGFVLVAIAACSYWLGPSVYSIKYAMSADKLTSIRSRQIAIFGTRLSAKRDAITKEL